MDLTSPRYERPALSLIERDIAGYGIDIYVGGMDGAGDLELLKENNITTVVNCAVNLDFNYATEPFNEGEDADVIYGVGAVRYYKLGLIDGHGNPETMMLSGCNYPPPLRCRSFSDSMGLWNALICSNSARNN